MPGIGAGLKASLRQPAPWQFSIEGFGEMLPDRRKYVFVGVDPDRVNLKVELQEAPSLFDFSELGPSEGESGK